MANKDVRIYDVDVKECMTNREYKIRVYKKRYPMYWDEGLNYRHGLPSYLYRAYKTWKYNRKKQYKQ